MFLLSRFFFAAKTEVSHSQAASCAKLQPPGGQNKVMEEAILF
jgi:hypothetical protein